MKLESESIFRSLEPPPGGTARLQAKLRATRERRPVAARIAGPAAVAALAALIFVAFGSHEPEQAVVPGDALYLAAAFDRLLGRPSEPVPIRVSVGGAEIGVSEIRTAAPGIRIFALESGAASAVTENTATP